MVEADYRRVMSNAEFEALQARSNDPIDAYYEFLIDRNERIGHEFYEQPNRLKDLTIGQRMLFQLGVFDSQVKNGGITQFFWNCRESIFDVADWIERLGPERLRDNYERALEELVGKKDRWPGASERMGQGARQSQLGDLPKELRVTQSRMVRQRLF
jgi:hypothetical protein